MKFMLKAKKYKTSSTKYGIWEFVLPEQFNCQRVGVVFNQSTGTLQIFEDNKDGCKVVKSTYPTNLNAKKVQFAHKKWLNGLGGEEIKPIEVEWKNGHASAQIRPPVINVYGDKTAIHKGHIHVPYIDIRDALRVVNDYVSDTDGAELEISDGILRIKKTVVEYI